MDFCSYLISIRQSRLSDYEFEVEAGKYVYALNTDNPKFGGQNRIDENVEHFTQYKHKKNLISLYIPSRLAVVLKMNE